MNEDRKIESLSLWEIWQVMRPKTLYDYTLRKCIEAVPHPCSVLEKLYFITILYCISESDHEEHITTSQRPRATAAEKPCAVGIVQSA